MTEDAQLFDWTLPAAGAIRTTETEGFIALAPGLHVEARLLHRRDFRARQMVGGTSVETLYSITFMGRAARIGDAQGVPLTPGQSAPGAELRAALAGVAEVLNAEITAVAQPDPDRLVEMLFRDDPPEMSLGRITARSRLGQALSGRRFDRGANRAALRGFLRRHGADEDTPAPEAPEAEDPWATRLRETLERQPRLSPVALSLAIDPAARQLFASFRAGTDSAPALPVILSDISPPELSLGPERFGDPEAQQQALAKCEVARLLHLALHLFPWSDWTLSARYLVPGEDGTETELHAARLSPDTSMVEHFSR